MTEVRKADPGARRQALGLVILGTTVGGLLLVAFERYRTPLRDWLLSEPEQLLDRVRLFLSVVAAVLSLPLVAFAAYLWSTGTKVVTAQGRNWGQTTVFEQLEEKNRPTIESPATPNRARSS